MLPGTPPRHPICKIPLAINLHVHVDLHTGIRHASYNCTRLPKYPPRDLILTLEKIIHHITFASIINIVVRGALSTVANVLLNRYTENPTATESLISDNGRKWSRSKPTAA
jgi:ABC-type Fe3+-siderophore transport system permease subunit